MAATLMMPAEELIAATAREQGFILTGFAPLRSLKDREAFFDQWLAEGRAADMTWLAREPERRVRSRRSRLAVRLTPGVRRAHQQYGVVFPMEFEVP